VILCDVAREDASVIISDLKELDIHRCGSIAVEHIDTSISEAAVAAEKAAPGRPSDAVVWEEVESRTSENTELSFSFVLFMIAAMQIAAVGIILDQPILIVGAMVVGVVISVTTIPAASNIGVAAANGEWNEAAGAAGQLALNLGGIVVAGVLTLFIQRRYYVARRRKHLMDPVRTAAGLPLGAALAAPPTCRA
jgi:hypothetical protein